MGFLWFGKKAAEQLKNLIDEHENLIKIAINREGGIQHYSTDFIRQFINNMGYQELETQQEKDQLEKLANEVWFYISDPFDN